MQTRTETPPVQFTDQQRQHRPDPDRIRSVMAKRSYATLASVSPAGNPHVVGVLYELVDHTLYFHTMRSSRKGRNIAESPNVGVCIPVRRLPVGPPSAVHFQSTARLVAPDSDEIAALVADGKLKSITGHGELDEPAGCFVAVTLPKRVLTYGLGMSLLQLIKAPLLAGGETTFER